MLTLPPPLAALGAWPQFVTWFAAPIPEKPGKFNKFPCHWQTGHVCDAQDPANWTTSDVALAVAANHDRGHGSGAGFVFTAQDPFFFHDIDGALGQDGQWSPLAHSLLARFPGAAVEVSHSGRGLHVIGRTAPIAHAKKNTPLGLELYTTGRFVALTGTNAIGDAALDCTPAVHQLVADFFQPTATGEVAAWTTEAVPEWDGPTDDDDLIRKAMASGQRSAAAAFGGANGDVTFADLWTADVAKLAAKWPGEGDKPFGQSEADQSLANHLAFWTGKNCERMERLMRRSALARDKWDGHRTYLVDTIVKAAAFVGKVAAGRAQSAPVVVPPTDPAQMAEAALAAGRNVREAAREYMGPYDQLAHFDGCFFLSSQSLVYSLPRNEVMARASFDVVYGGHLFVLDPMGQKTTDSAWEAFTKSRVNAPVIVNDLCFRPELEQGAVVRDGNRARVNSYVPYDPRILEGDASPFLNHLAKMLRDERDRAILLNWMARVAQSPGRKLQWWPVIQGVQGNGKSTIINVLSYLIGEEYTHLVNVDAMAKTGGQFNDWLYRKLLVGLEELKVSDRREFLEILKPIVTAERLAFEGKGIKQVTADNRANGVITTNYKDGMPIDDKERRYGIFFTAQQTELDLQRDGMTDEYFADLRDWWKGEGVYAVQGASYGLAVVAHFLTTFQIEAALDPARHSRAPETSTTREAVSASRGRVEQEVLEAIEEGRPGFSGGWVSSKYLDALIDQMRAGVPRAKRRALMQSLGYDWHPALHEGRVNDTVMPDAAKPKLYLKYGHLALNVSAPAEIARLYSKAQAPESGTTSAAVAFGGAKA